MPDHAPVGDEKRAELLHDHYKDTFQHVLEHWKARNRLFAMILVTLALMLFQFTSPNTLEHLVNSYILDQAKYDPARQAAEPAAEASAVTNPNAAPSSNDATNSNDAAGARAAGPNAAAAGRTVLVDFRFITTMLWFILAYLLVNYYQKSILVERLYIYLGRTEQRISRYLGRGFVTRESEFYMEARPTFLKRVSFIYRWVFAGLLALVVVAKIIQEWRSPETRAGGGLGFGFTAVDTLIALTILYYSTLYFRWPFQPKPSTDLPEDAAVESPSVAGGGAA